MEEPKTTTQEAIKAMTILANARGPLTAIQIGVQLGLAGSHETVRRRVRAIMKTLREEGEWIVATNFDGYWLTEDPAVWRKYNNGEALSAKHILAEVSRRQKQIPDRKGQTLLFGLDKPVVSTGHG